MIARPSMLFPLLCCGGSLPSASAGSARRDHRSIRRAKRYDVVLPFRANLAVISWFSHMTVQAKLSPL